VGARDGLLSSSTHTGTHTQAHKHTLTYTHAADSNAPGSYEELVALETALTGLIAQRSMDKVNNRRK
jgi:hypothetical protein